MNDIIREIKLSKILNSTTTGLTKQIMEFFDDMFKDMNVIIDTDMGIIKCWKDNQDYYYFKLDVGHSPYLCCNYNKIGHFINRELLFSIIDTKLIIKEMLSNFLYSKSDNLDLKIPDISVLLFIPEWDWHAAVGHFNIKMDNDDHK